MTDDNDIQLDFTDSNISKYELNRRNQAWGEMKNYSDEQRSVVDQTLAELYAIVNTSDMVMPPIEKFMRTLDVAARGAAAANDEASMPSDVLRAALTVHKVREFGAIVELAAKGDEDALRWVQGEIKTRMEDMGFPREMVEAAMIVPISPDELRGLMGTMNGEDENEDAENGGPSKKALDLLLGRDNPS